MDTSKYTRRFFPAPGARHRWAEKNYIEKPPVWCSVDLRDGNQALVVPMSMEEKLDFFSMLVRLGLKEIEVGFPAASETEYEFLRRLIDGNLIPDDVTIQVLTQSREHIIRKTFEALEGCENAIVHLYNSVSRVQREQVFRKNRDEIKKIATDGAEMITDYIRSSGKKYRYEYSPESFTETEPEYALEVCNAVLDIFKPSNENRVIINLPVTVELSSPNVYADSVEYICDNISYRDCVDISLHPHNDRGCAVASAELGLLAGADRVEGTLFGNGERTGNVDLITLALNLFTHGIDPKLDLDNIPGICSLYESVTGMDVYERLPYSGKLVFAAFSGSHQDAIAKSVKWRKENGEGIWNVPYLPIDPKDIGRDYEGEVIRINSQSGKGGIGYVLEHNFGYQLPAKMREDVGYTVKSISDRAHSELSPDEVLDIFLDEYVNISGYINLVDFKFSQTGKIRADLELEISGENRQVTAYGNGRLDAVSNAVREAAGVDFSELTYEEHALTQASTSKAITYMSIKLRNGKKVWGAGIHDDILASSIYALFSAVNRAMKDRLA